MASGAVASEITGVGIVVSVPLGVVGAVCGLVSNVLTTVNKKVEKRVNKHSRLSALAAAQHDTIRSFVSQALDDNKVSDAEFKHITQEIKSYNQMKWILREKYAKKQAASPAPDIEKIKEEIREEFPKKLPRPAPLRTEIRR